MPCEKQGGVVFACLPVSGYLWSCFSSLILMLRIWVKLAVQSQQWVFIIILGLSIITFVSKMSKS